MATVGTDSEPHLVPITFAIENRVVYSMVDHKPKSTLRLRRLDNIRHNPRVSLLVDHYESEWTNLWWVRIDGTATVVDSGGGWETARRLLTEKYHPYRLRPPDGPAVVVEITAVRSWEGKG